MSNKVAGTADTAGLEVTHYLLPMPEYTDLVDLGWSLNIYALESLITSLCNEANAFFLPFHAIRQYITLLPP